jgi:hypothetical protein
LGKPFHDELEKLSDTYEWARRFEVSVIRDALRPLSSESKREASRGALFAPGLSLWIFSRDTLLG